MFRQVRTIQDVTRWGLCIGCGACASACQQGGLRLVNIENEGIRPVFNPSVCASCTECLKVCPGYHVDTDLMPNGLPRTSLADHEFGPVLEIWEGHAADPELRYRGSSGAMLSALALYCLEREGMDSVLHVGMDEEAPWLNRTVQSRTRGELLGRAGSRYAPASPCDSLDEVELSERPVVFIGKPCDTAGLALSRRQRPELDKKVGLTLSFFCAGAPSTRGTLDLLGQMMVKPEALTSLRYRGEGWPGGFKARVEGTLGEREEFMSYAESWDFLNGYRPMRCHLCPDGLGRIADISCGDAWQDYTGDGNMGESLVLVRTERGREILRRAAAAGYVALRPQTAEAVFSAQKNLLEKRRLLFGRLLAMKLLLIPTPRFKGFSLLRGWLALSLATKARTILGTLRRLVQRGQWKARPLRLTTDPAVAAAASPRSRFLK